MIYFGRIILNSNLRTMSSHRVAYRVPGFIKSCVEPGWLDDSWDEILTMRRRYRETTKTFDAHTIASYFRLKLTFNSNRLEGNSFTESEVARLMNGVTIGGKPLQDLLDVHQHDVAVMKLLQGFGCGTAPFTECLITELHKLCIPEHQGTYEVIPGSYKTLANAVHATDPRTGMMHTQIYVEPEKVAAEMQQLVQWTVENERKMPFLSFITLFHYNFVRIHPFVDGNGRTARLLTGLLCLRQGFPPIIIQATHREQYIAALTCAHKYLDFDPLLDMIAVAMTETMEDFLDAHKV